MVVTSLHARPNTAFDESAGPGNYHKSFCRASSIEGPDFIRPKPDDVERFYFAP
jgi:hypothetical protein